MFWRFEVRNMEMTKFKNNQKTLIQMAESVGVTPKELWLILAGKKTAGSMRVANKIHEETDLKVDGLMFRTLKQIRFGTLEWMAQHMPITKNTICRALQSAIIPRESTRDLFYQFTGMEPHLWDDPHSNWLIVRLPGEK